MDRADMNDIVFGGTPPPAPAPVPEPVRRDSLGRRITELRLEALRPFKPGHSGYPGANFKRQREHAMAVVIRLMKQDKLKPSDTIADFMNLLGDMETRADQRTLQRLTRSEQRRLKCMLSESDASLSRLVETSADDLRDSGIGASSRKNRRSTAR